MQRHWIEAAVSTQRRVGVLVGALASEVNPLEAAPLVRPARVLGPATGGSWWLAVETVTDLPSLEQMYREDEILGFWPDERV